MSEAGPPPLGYHLLFLEIGVTLLVTTLLGALGGLWLVTGFFLGAGTGAYGIYKWVSRYLATIE